MTTAELAARFGVYPTMIASWKHSLLESISEIFGKNLKFRKQSGEQIDELYRQIGKLKVERDFLSKKLSL